MKHDDLRRLSQHLDDESPMTQVALDDLQNPERIRRQLVHELERNIRDHGSGDDLTRRIMDVTGMDANRAKRISVTERTRTSNGERYKRLIDEFLRDYDKSVRWHKKRPKKPRVQWVHRPVAKEPRQRHIALSGEVKDIGEEFLPGVKFPGDPDGPAAEVISCHCYIRRYVFRRR